MHVHGVQSNSEGAKQNPAINSKVRYLPVAPDTPRDPLSPCSRLAWCPRRLSGTDVTSTPFCPRSSAWAESIEDTRRRPETKRMRKGHHLLPQLAPCKSTTDVLCPLQKATAPAGQPSPYSCPLQVPAAAPSPCRPQPQPRHSPALTGYFHLVNAFVDGP